MTKKLNVTHEGVLQSSRLVETLSFKFRFMQRFPSSLLPCGGHGYLVSAVQGKSDVETLRPFLL
jgi:hypothetical protein